MATLTIRNLDDDVKAKLRVAAAMHGHSMEEEVRVILQRAVTTSDPSKGFGSRVHQVFAGIQDAEFELPARSSTPRGADFSE